MGYHKQPLLFTCKLRKSFCATRICESLTSAVTVSIFVFAVGFGRFFNKSRGSRSVSVFMVVYKQYHTWQVAICGRKITYMAIQ